MQTGVHEIQAKKMKVCKEDAKLGPVRWPHNKRKQRSIQFMTELNTNKKNKGEKLTMKKMNLTAIIAAMTIAASAMAAVPAAAAQAQITEAQAKEIALKDAGLKEADVTFVRSNIDYDDGVMEYEVEFFSGNTEYDYDIDAMTGAIRARDFDCEFYAPTAGNTTNTGAPAGGITQDQAVEIALKHAGLSKADVSNIHAHQDFDDGMEQIDIKFFRRHDRV